MNRHFTRRRLLEIAPMAALATLAACSKTPEPVATTPSPPAPATMPPVAAPTVEPSPAAAPPPPPPAGPLAMLDEKDAQAAALGYVADASRVDREKFKAYVPGSQCSGCTQYSGKPGDTTGPCTIFPGKGVAAAGWCSAFIKKA